MKRAVYILDSAFITTLGSELDTMRKLSEPAYPSIGSPDLGLIAQNLISDSDQAPLCGSVPETRSERIIRILAEKLVGSMSEEDRRGCALIFGNTNSGVAECIRAASSADESSLAFRSIELGSSAPRLSRRLGLYGPAWVVSTACTAGLKAICDAARLISSGKADFAIAGGADAASPLTEAGFSALGARTEGGCSRPFCEDRSGMHLGEGGALLLLSSRPQAFGIKAAAEISGWAETSDAHHISAPKPDGEFAALAMKLALEHAGRPKLDFIACHGTGTKQNDAMESKAVRSIGLSSIPQASLKGRIGHLLGGAGAVNAAVCHRLLKESGGSKVVRLPLNYFSGARPDPEAPEGLTGPFQALGRIEHAMSTAFAFGGSNVAVVFSRHQNS